MKRLPALAVIVLLSLNTPSANAAPLSFNTALPVHKGGLLYRGQVIWNRSSDLDREKNVVEVPSVLVYGATPKLALIGIFPYVTKRFKTESTGVTRSASGLGDITTIARYQIFQRNKKGRTLRGALFAGMKWPTGKDTATDSRGTVPRSVQLGTGSFDPILGTVWTGQWLDFEVDGDILYQRKTHAGGFKAGDLLRKDVSLQVRLLPRELGSSGIPNFLYGVLEFNSIFEAKNENQGVKDPNSGGYRLLAVPGLQWVSKRLVLEVGAQLPLVENLNGSALERDFTLIGSLRYWF